MTMSGIRPSRRGEPGSSAVGQSGSEPSTLSVTGSRAGGALLYVLAFVGIFVGGHAGGPAGAAVSFVLAMPLFWVAARLLVRAKRQAAPDARTLLARDRRPPVAYFRSFVADRTAAKGVTFSSWFTEEEQLARVMRDVGPLIAIGEPSESLPPLGAARLYVGTDDWRQVVHSLTTRARLVMLRLGRSPGLIWEFENVLRWARPEQVVLLVPKDERLYDEFRRHSRALLPYELPPLGGRGSRRLFRGSLRAMITFGPTWTPTLVDLQAISLPLLRRSPAYPLVPVLQLALRPVLSRLGVPWKPLRYSARMIVTICSLLVMVWSLYVLYS